MNGPYLPSRLTSSEPHHGQTPPDATFCASSTCCVRAVWVEPSARAASDAFSSSNVAASNIGSKRARSYRMLPSRWWRLQMTYSAVSGGTFFSSHLSEKTM